MDGFMRALVSVWTDSGFAALTWENVVMILVGLVLLYLAIAKEYEPLLLLPIAFGDIMANFPNTGFETDMGVMMAIGFGIKYEIFPPLIFMGVCAMTDFGPLIANPKTVLLGAAAQIGVFVALAGAMMLGFNVQEAASIGIIGGADGPTAIYLTTKLAPHLLGAIAVAADSATDHETLHHQRTASDPHGQPSSCNPLRKGCIPDRRCYRSFPASAASSSPDGMPLPRQPV